MALAVRPNPWICILVPKARVCVSPNLSELPRNEYFLCFPRSFPPFPPKHSPLFVSNFTPTVFSSLVSNEIDCTLSSTVDPDWREPTSACYLPMYYDWLMDRPLTQFPPIRYKERFSEVWETDKCSALQETYQNNSFVSLLGIAMWGYVNRRLQWVHLRGKPTRQHRESSRNKARALMTAWTPGSNHSWIRISQSNSVIWANNLPNPVPQCRSSLS